LNPSSDLKKTSVLFKHNSRPEVGFKKFLLVICVNNYNHATKVAHSNQYTRI